MAILYDQEETLRQRVSTCLEDDFKHNAIETAQETFYKKRKGLVEQMPAWQELRSEAEQIRNHVTQNLDYYVAEFAKNAQARGNTLHFAPTAEDALWEILDIFEQNGASKCVKSKSMMTEEMGMNDVLQEAGIEVVETDCAENILQTAADKPSHIVVPALHFDRAAIAQLYREKEGYTGSDVPEEITHFLRKLLREKFLDADVSVRGCNFAVASTGSTTLVTNEGNGRMVDTYPPVQIVVVGIDRIVPDLESLDTMMALLVRSAVGAKMTTYFSVDTGPRRSDEVDGARDVHIVIMDNGRSNLIGGQFEPMLRCIRCGACLNTCPVYRHITGHGYGSIYPGPMGIVLTAALEGYENIDMLPYACTLCGACDDDCPVRIPLHELIRDHRINMVAGGYTDIKEKPLFASASRMLASAPRYMTAMPAARTGMKAAARGCDYLTADSTWIPVLKGWTATRDMPVLAPYRFRTWFEQHERESLPFNKDGSPSAHLGDRAADAASAPKHAASSIDDAKAGGAE